MQRFLALLFAFTAAACSSETAASSAPAGKAKTIASADANDLMEMQRRVMTEAQAALAGATDAASAEEAKAALEKLARQIAPMRARREELMNAASPQDKLKFAQDLMGMLGEFEGVGNELERLDSIPGIREALEPSMEPILGLFDSSR